MTVAFIDADGKARTVSPSFPLPTGGGSGAAANQVQGNVAAGAADAGNPIKVGGRYNTTSPTLTNGQRGDLQLDASGNLEVTLVHASDLANLAGATDIDGVAVSNTANRLGTVSFNYVFNGTTWDRARGNSRASFVCEPPLTSTARSATVTTVSAILIPANTTRAKFIIKNDSATDIWINIGSTAVAAAGAGNIKIAANGYFELQGTNQIITVICATGTANITCYEF